VGSIPPGRGSRRAASRRAGGIHALGLGARQLRDSRVPSGAVLSGSPAVESPKTWGNAPARGAVSRTSCFRQPPVNAGDSVGAL
jgi:hypothetical protein